MSCVFQLKLLPLHSKIKNQSKIVMEKISLNNIILNNAINLITSANFMLKKALIANGNSIFTDEEIEKHNLDFYMNDEKYAIIGYYIIKNKEEEDDYDIMIRVYNTETDVMLTQKASYVETYFRCLYVNMLSVIADWDNEKLNKN